MTRALTAISCCWVLLASALLNACGSGTSTAAVICVGNIRVSQAELDHWEPVLAALSPSAANIVIQANASGMTGRQRALRFLAAVARTTGEARLVGVQVQNALASRTMVQLEHGGSYGSVSQSLRMSELVGVIDGSIRNQADRVAIVKNRLLAETISAKQRSTAEQAIPARLVAAYYANRKSSFVVPERRDVAVIETFKRSKSVLARQEIEAGKSLPEVVKRRNDETLVGGIKHNLIRNHLFHGYEANYFTAKPHVLVGPLKAEIYYLFEVLAVHPRRLTPLAEAEPGIRSTLISHSQRQVLTRLEQRLHERWNAESRCTKAS